MGRRPGPLGLDRWRQLGRAGLRARAYHGFVGREGAVVAAITSFAGSLR